MEKCGGRSRKLLTALPTISTPPFALTAACTGKTSKARWLTPLCSARRALYQKEDADAQIISALGDILDDLDSGKLDFSGGGREIYTCCRSRADKAYRRARESGYTTARKPETIIALDIPSRREVGEYRNFSARSCPCSAESRVPMHP